MLQCRRLLQKLSVSVQVGWANLALKRDLAHGCSSADQSLSPPSDEMIGPLITVSANGLAASREGCAHGL